MKKEIFCEECGSKLQEELIGAENYEECVYSCPIAHHPYHKFNRDTGERQYVLKYTCPNYNSGSGKYHDHFIKDEVISLSDFNKTK